jgi:hypothetical protein
MAYVVGEVDEFRNVPQASLSLPEGVMPEIEFDVSSLIPA